MAAFQLGLLMILQLGTISTGGSVFQSKDCGPEQLSYLRPSSDLELLYINGKAVDAVLFCERLEFHYAGGCFCGSEVVEWGGVGKKYCGLELSVFNSLECIHPAVDVPQRAGRKLLPELKTNDSLVQSTEEKHSNSVSLNPKNIAMAASGMFLLCCALVCPCFRARRKETAHTALTKEPNSNFEQEHFDSLRTEFSSEIELLAKIEHRNLVKLLGYVDKGTERVIITEYIPNGTLREHLDGQHGRILDFNQRLEIAIDVTHALTYLHLYAEKPIIHRDVKSSNILLTESFRAKVADFGFARLGPMEADQTHISTKVKGTAGYLDPEYLKTYQLTPKSDVYSFGILLVEILSGRRPVELKRSADERVTVRWAFKKYNEGNFGDVMDPSMQEVVDGEILSKMFGLAFQCAAPTRSDRPTMKEVGEQLWGIRIDYLRSVRRG
ncbi:calmodulin-binding receptor-like cytoplasmic kinase 3 isoform X2 [Magnolia sinica]|uniref:calmodulin-binding receptor-like cytoplasmic kinase 3 isoform X2 n=1 Tax=Magnolia sinica TaxID=86752 RepID=UPI002659A6A4|nr:calmodulin-binding receptor-like cytoplasmic kinase 3 isoform X2 [Magnolia sinica]